MKPLSLANKITAFSTAAIFLTAFIISYVIFSTVKTEFKQQLNESYKKDTLLVAKAIQSKLNKMLTDINALSNTPPIQGMIRSSAANHYDEQEKSTTEQWKNRLGFTFKGYLRSNPGYSQIRYISFDDNGRELVRVDSKPASGIYQTHESSLQQKGSRDYSIYAKRLSQGSVAFTDVEYNIERGKIQVPKVLTIRILQPVYTDRQQAFGFIIINADVEFLLREEMLEHANKHKLLLADSAGNIISYDTSSDKFSYIDNSQLKQEGYFGNRGLDSVEKIITHLKEDPEVISSAVPIYADPAKKILPFTLLTYDYVEHAFNTEKLVLRKILEVIILLCVTSSLVVFIYNRKIMSNLLDLADTLSPKRASSAKLEAFINMTDEVGILARAFQEKTKLLENMALFDSMTGLPNRKSIYGHIEDAMMRCKRTKLSVAIIFCDINGFKEINDTYGHEYGDAVLIAIAKKMKHATRETDMCGRVAGDEFMIVAENVGSDEELHTCVQRFRDELNTSYQIKGHTFSIELSYGVAIYPDDDEKVDGLIAKADQAMYASKKHGVGEAIYYKDMTNTD